MSFPSGIEYFVAGLVGVAGLGCSPSPAMEKLCKAMRATLASRITSFAVLDSNYSRIISLLPVAPVICEII